jgi:hypothetical protein
VGEAAAMNQWDLFPEYRPRKDICPGDQTADGDSYGWSTVRASVPCGEHEDCHILSYLGDQVGTHRHRERTILSRLPVSRDTSRLLEHR